MPEYTFEANQSQTEYAGETVISSPLNQDPEGNLYFYMGTYRVKEISPPELYQLNGTIRMSYEDASAEAQVTEGCVLVIDYDDEKYEANYKRAGNVIQAENLSIHAYDYVHLSMLTVTKYGNSHQPLAGVAYKLVRAADGEELEIQTTGSDGKATFEGLIPGDYVLTEIQTADGYNLLKENISVTVPCQMTEEEIAETGADITKAYFDEASQTFCFEAVNYDITDSVHFDMPLTGGNQTVLYLLLAVSFVFLTAGGYLFFRKKVE